MVKKLTLFLAYAAIFILALIAFMPKESVYFFAEQKLKEFDIVISDETSKDKLFSFEIDNAVLFAQNIEAAKIFKTDVTLLGVYNSIEAKQIALASIVETFLPSNIEELKIVYTLVNPLEVSLWAQGDFGELKGVLSLLDQKILVTLKPSKIMLSKYKTTLKEFKKQANGEYIYAQTL